MEPDASEHVDRLCALAEGMHHRVDTGGDAITIMKSWCAPARTFTYHTHVSAGGGDRDLLDPIADTFYRAATLEEQPWYAQFRGGAARPWDSPLPAGIERQQLCQSSFDVGLSKLRCYRQLVSAASPGSDVRVVSLVSVDDPWPIPADAVLALTSVPTGDVFEWRENRLHWHHICTTPGVGLLPGPWDRWFLNALRRLGLDGSERRTYRDEALGWRRWTQEWTERRRAEGRAVRRGV